MDGDTANRIGTQTGGNRHSPSTFCPALAHLSFVRPGFLSRYGWKFTAF